MKKEDLAALYSYRMPSSSADSKVQKRFRCAAAIQSALMASASTQRSYEGNLIANM